MTDEETIRGLLARIEGLESRVRALETALTPLRPQPRDWWQPLPSPYFPPAYTPAPQWVQPWAPGAGDFFPQQPVITCGGVTVGHGVGIAHSEQAAHGEG